MKCILPSLLLAIQSAYAIPFEAPQRLPEDPLELSSNQCPPILVIRALETRNPSTNNQLRVRITPFNRVRSAAPLRLV